MGSQIYPNLVGASPLITLAATLPVKKSLDPQKAMITLHRQEVVEDVEFKLVGTVPIYQRRSRESMMKWVKSRESMRESEGVKELPPLDIILYDNDLIERAWCWDRLLPWTSGYVFVEQYLAYLKDYLQRNRDYTSACDAAKRCLMKETELSDAISKFKSIHSDDGLMLEINKEANGIIGSALDCPLAAACFMCIAQEAKLMSKWLTSCARKDDESMAKSWKWKSDFCYNVQKLALNIFTTYKENNKDYFIASMLGMRNEAATACRLLGNYVERAEEVKLCEELRCDLLDLLVFLQEWCPQDSAIVVDQNHHPVDQTSLQISVERKELPTGYQDFHISDGISSIPSTPMENSAPATPVSSSARFANDDALDQCSNTKKRNIEELQESGAYSLLASGTRKHCRVEEEFGSESSVDGVAASITPTTIKSATFATPSSWASPTDSYGSNQGTNLRIPMESYADESVQDTQGSEVPSSQADPSVVSANVHEE